MALVAFDLDNTLGFFYHIGIWADFFSIETIDNKFNRRINPTMSLSPSLKRKIRSAEKVFIKKILERVDIMNLMFRPNLSAMLEPIMEAKKSGKVKAVCIYSNSWNSFVLHVAKEIIETVYTYPGFFDCLVDATHPIRAYDWSKKKHGEPSKNFITLKKIFKDLCGVKTRIDPRNCMFVDERIIKHDIMESERDGLVYLKPTAFSPKLTDSDREKIFEIGLDVLDECELLNDSQYLDSDLFDCKKYSSTTNLKKISNIDDLLDMAEAKLDKEGIKGIKFVNDTNEITKIMKTFLKRF